MAEWNHCDPVPQDSSYPNPVDGSRMIEVHTYTGCQQPGLQVKSVFLEGMAHRIPNAEEDGFAGFLEALAFLQNHTKSYELLQPEPFTNLTILPEWDDGACGTRRGATEAPAASTTASAPSMPSPSPADSRDPSDSPAAESKTSLGSVQTSPSFCGLLLMPMLLCWVAGVV